VKKIILISCLIFFNSNTFCQEKHPIFINWPITQLLALNKNKSLAYLNIFQSQSIQQSNINLGIGCFNIEFNIDIGINKIFNQSERGVSLKISNFILMNQPLYFQTHKDKNIFNHFYHYKTLYQFNIFGIGYKFNNFSIILNSGSGKFKNYLRTHNSSLEIYHNNLPNQNLDKKNKTKFIRIYN
jgi:hypothetical protein